MNILFRKYLNYQINEQININDYLKENKLPEKKKKENKVLS